MAFQWDINLSVTLSVTILSFEQGCSFSFVCSFQSISFLSVFSEYISFLYFFKFPINKKQTILVLISFHGRFICLQNLLQQIICLIVLHFYNETGTWWLAWPNRKVVYTISDTFHNCFFSPNLPIK